MNLFATYRSEVDAAVRALAADGLLPVDLDTRRITVEPPRDDGHGDLSTNAALVLAKPAGRKPRDLAAALAARLGAVAGVAAVDIAGPGFINLTLADAVWREHLRVVLRSGPAYGSTDTGAGQPINVEYVSANPTGPLHAAHGRGAVVGDVIANLLEKIGHPVTREYYVNDAGAQVDVLARSAWLRYREALGDDIGEIPSGFYPGQYLKAVGVALADRYGDRLRTADEAEWLEPVRTVAIDMMMTEVKDDLAALGVHHAVFSSERRLVDAGGVESVFTALEEKGLLYTGVLEPPKGKVPDDWEPRPQTLFRATDFGDDVDRPLRKSDGSWTYFAADIAYHLDKFRRGCPVLIDVLGADHGGYVKRMQAAVTAVTGGAGRMDARICQMVNMMQGGKPVPMSKRAGTFVTLRDVIDQVGKDVFRFIMVTRRNDQTLEFDFEKVLEDSKDNPVFYVQYAHARICSVLRRAGDSHPALAGITDAALANADLSSLSDPTELKLIKLVAAFPRTVEAAADHREPHRIAFYLNELAAAFHGLWSQGRQHATLQFIDPDDADRTRARLALLRAVATVITSGLHLFGVEPAKEMR